MRTYSNKGGDSNVRTYEYGEDWIAVTFSDGSTYEYQSAKIGQHHIARMKQLADSGKGLNAYINTHPEVSKGYSRKS